MKPLNAPRSQASGITASLFFVALVIGIVAIILLKISGSPQLVVTAAPVMVMLVYAAIIYYVRKLRLRLDQAGDNLYYLGFLFTLASLAHSLLEFGNSGSGTSLIITNFGIAIWTTITGLALRVIFSQMRTDPMETENLARVELGEASRHLRVELDNAAREFSMFRRSLQQMMAEAFQELQEELSETMRGSLNQFVGTVTEANKGLESRSEAFRESSNKLVESISALALKINKIEVSDDILVRQLQPAINKIDESAQQLTSSLHNLSEGVGSIEISGSTFIDLLQPAIDKISEAAEVAQNNANTDTVRAQAWAELSDKVASVMNGIHESLKGAQESSSLFVKGAESVQVAAEQMSSLAEHMNGIDLKLGTIVESTDRDIKRVVGTVIKNLDGLSHQLSAQASRINMSVSEPKIKATLNTITPANPNITTPVKDSKNEAK
jgi:methyl-accepting chemotaxis protein